MKKLSAISGQPSAVSQRSAAVPAARPRRAIPRLAVIQIVKAQNALEACLRTNTDPVHEILIAVVATRSAHALIEECEIMRQIKLLKGAKR